MILLTGVGTRLLAKVLAARYGEGRFAEALRALTVVARGPKPVAALREMDVKPAVVAPEPNTWRELVAAIEGRPERRIAVQEYGRSNPDMLATLRARGAEVTTVRVYGWDLPEDTAPLREAARRLAHGEADVALFTTARQIDHLMKIAEDEGLEREVREALRARGGGLHRTHHHGGARRVRHPCRSRALAPQDGHPGARSRAGGGRDSAAQAATIRLHAR